jgi:hypothetical protein
LASPAKDKNPVKSLDAHVLSAAPPAAAQNFLLEQLHTCKGLGMTVPQLGGAVPENLIIYGGPNDFPGEVVKRAYAAATDHFGKKPNLIFVCLLDRGAGRAMSVSTVLRVPVWLPCHVRTETLRRWPCLQGTLCLVWLPASRGFSAAHRWCKLQPSPGA